MCVCAYQEKGIFSCMSRLARDLYFFIWLLLLLLVCFHTWFIIHKILSSLRNTFPISVCIARKLEAKRIVGRWLGGGRGWNLGEDILFSKLSQFEWMGKLYKSLMLLYYAHYFIHIRVVIYFYVRQIIYVRTSTTVHPVQALKSRPILYTRNARKYSLSWCSSNLVPPHSLTWLPEQSVQLFD